MKLILALCVLLTACAADTMRSYVGQDIRNVELIEQHGLANAPAAEVHEGLGLQQQDAAKVDLSLGEQAVKLS